MIQVSSAAPNIYSDASEVEDQRILCTLSGHPASNGIAVGLCRVLSSLEDASELYNGAILLFKTASPKLYRFIPHAKALITEQGGPLATACIFAREHGIPAVVGVKGILDSIHDGDLVRVDGERGTVDLLG